MSGAFIAGIIVVLVIALIAVTQRSGPRITTIETKPEDVTNQEGGQ